MCHCQQPNVAHTLVARNPAIRLVCPECATMHDASLSNSCGISPRFYFSGRWREPLPVYSFWQCQTLAVFWHTRHAVLVLVLLGVWYSDYRPIPLCHTFDKTSSSAGMVGW